MIRSLLVVLLVGISVSSCNEQEFTPIPQEDMEKILLDIHLAEVYSTMVNDEKHKTINKNLDSLSAYYNMILSHHDLTYEELKNNMNWYSANPEELDTVYINMMDQLSTVEGVLNAK